MNAGLWALIGLGIFAVIVIIWVISFYNSVKLLDNNNENSFAQIDVQLKRRSDLIPNLVETIKGYTKHESTTLKEIIEARNKYVACNTAGEKIEAGANLGNALSRLNVVVEQYPVLKADQGFLSLQKELGDTENKISHFRQFYNDSVLIFNRKIATFPNLILSALFKITKKPYYKVEEYDRQNVSIKF